MWQWKKKQLLVLSLDVLSSTAKSHLNDISLWKYLYTALPKMLLAWILKGKSEKCEIVPVEGWWVKNVVKKEFPNVLHVNMTP